MPLCLGWLPPTGTVLFGSSSPPGRSQLQPLSRRAFQCFPNRIGHVAFRLIAQRGVASAELLIDVVIGQHPGAAEDVGTSVGFRSWRPDRDDAVCLIRATTLEALVREWGNEDDVPIAVTRLMVDIVTGHSAPPFRSCARATRS